MKFAVISDIHGNIVALRAALAEMERERADRLLVLGDLFGPGHVQDILAELRGREALVIRGNGEGYLLENDGDTWERYDQFAAIAAVSRALTPEDMRWIAALPEQMALIYPGIALRMMHGSPRASNENLLGGKPAALRRALRMTSESILLCGHSHRAMLKQRGGRTICNAGSVGENFVGANPAGENIARENTGPAFTADVTFITYAGGEIAFDQRRVPYDFAAWQRVAGDLIYTRLSLRGARQGRNLFREFLNEAARRGGWPVPNEVWNGLFAEWEEGGLV